MPRVPEYGAPKVQTRPLASSYLQAPDDRSGQILAAGGQDFGQGLQRLGAGFEQMAVRHDEAAVKQLDIEAGQLETAALYDADNGLFHKRGRDALDLAPTVSRQLDEKYKELEGKARGTRQREMLQFVLAKRKQDAERLMGQFLARETDSYNDQVSAGRITSLADEAIRAFTVDPNQTRVKLQAALDERSDFDKRSGSPADYSAAEQLKLSSHVWKGVARQFLALDKPHEAKKVIEENRGQMLAADFYELMAPVKDAIDTLDAENWSGNAVAAGIAGVEGEGSIPIEAGPPPPPTNVPLGAQPVAQRIRQVARASGATPEEAERMIRDAAVESNFNPRAVNGSNKGLFQFNTRGGDASTWGRFGGRGDPHDIDSSIRAKLKLDRHNEKLARKAVGRNPAAWEMYLVHQQGDAGGPALLRAPANMSAVEALKAVGVSHKTAVASIAGNGGRADMTAGQFRAYWRDRYNNTTIRGGAQAAASPMATGTPNVIPDRSTLIRQAEVAAGDDPVRQARFRAAAERRWVDMKQARAEQEADALNAVQPYLQAGVPFSKWPGDVRSRLDPKDVTRFMEAEAKGAERKTDPATVYHLSELYASDPKRFLQVNPATYVGKLDEEDFQTVLGWRREAIKPDKAPEQVTHERIRSVAKGMFEAAGFDLDPPTAKGKSVNYRGEKKPAEEVEREHRVVFNAFMRKMSEEVSRRSRLKGSALTDEEIQGVADAQLLRGSWEAATSGGERVRREHLPIFLAPANAPIVYDIPKASRDRITGDLRARLRREPTGREVTLIWLQARARGLTP